jgi:hypothetical protein
MMQYLSEIKEIVSKYSRIRSEMENLSQMVESLNLRKQQIELELSTTREIERALIDKIKTETGEEPDFYKILQELTADA